MTKQDIIGPFSIGEGKITFAQNSTTNGFSNGYTIRYTYPNCKNIYPSGWVSLGTVNKEYIETAKKTIEQFYHLVDGDAQELAYICTTVYSKRKRTVEIDIRGKRKVNAEWIPLINSYIDELFEAEN